jgi:fosfomycin resistance protein FosX
MPLNNLQMKIAAISHITLICRNLEKTTKLFKELFGAEEIYSSDKKIFSIAKEKFFNLAGLWIAIMEGESTEKTYNHIAFKINASDLAFFAEKIKLLGLELLPSRKRETAEGDSLYFYDYDNHLFELHTGDLTTRLKFYNKTF